jgi:hypothetical protein
MHVLIAVTVIFGYAATLIYALWRVAQDLLIRRYADGDDYDVAPKANQHLSVVQIVNTSIDELHSDRKKT